jgi:hypothetical protein
MAYSPGVLFGSLAADMSADKIAILRLIFC